MSPKVEKKGPSKLAPITFPIKVVWRLSLFLVITIILGTVFDYIGIWLGWWTHDHQLHVLASDISYLGKNFTMSIFGSSPAELAIDISQQIQIYLTPSNWFENATWVVTKLLHEVFLTVEPFWQAIVYSAMTVGVRCFIIAMSILLFVFVAIVASVDGLVERELRKEGGGIEQAKVYHHAKTWVSRVIIVAPIIYLSWPETINPSFIVLPSAAAFGIATYLTFSTYKKYL